MSTTIETGPLVDQFAEAAAEHRSAYEAILYMAHQGKLGALAKELGHLAELMEQVYTPPANRGEAEKYDGLAKSVRDRDLARYYLERARRARSQAGEDK